MRFKRLLTSGSIFSYFKKRKKRKQQMLEKSFRRLHLFLFFFFNKKIWEPVMPLKGPWLLSHKYSLDCKALKANPLTVNSQDLWLAKDNRFLNPKISYERILMAPPCRLISFKETIIIRADMFGDAINRILSLGEIHSWDSISCCLRIFS